MSYLSVPGLLRTEKIGVPSPAGTFLEAAECGEIDKITSWLSSSVERREGSPIQGKGVFAVVDIPKGMLVAIKQGRVVDERTILDNASVINGSHQQIGDNRFLAGLDAKEVDSNLVGYNHSCDPNAKIVILEGFDLAFLVTREPVKTGEELTTDYAASWDSDTQYIEPCSCGSTQCRGVIDPKQDWRNPALQKRYAGEFPYYMQQKLDRL